MADAKRICPVCNEIWTVGEDGRSGEVLCPRCGSSVPENAVTLVDTGQTTEPFPPGGAGEERLPEIPGYEVIDVVARGGMGVVLKARHVVLDRLAAVKLPLPGVMADEANRERFLREGRSAANLRHPNICPIYEVGESPDRPFIAMAFIEGHTLRDWTKANPPTPRQSAEVVAALASAVGYAHDHGVLHRDIKSSNVMMDAESGDPVLTDFGLAKELGAEGPEVTASGAVVGTPAYMAPEQAAGQADRVGPHTDVYAMGVVLYELLCGRPPFLGTKLEVLVQVGADEPVPPRKLNPAVPLDLETVCLRAMAKSPSERYPSAQALADDLRRWLNGEPVRARRAGPLERLWRWARRNPTVAALSAAAVLLLAAVAVVASIGYVQTSRALTREEAARRDADAATQREATQRKRAEDALAKEAAARRETEAQWQRAQRNLYFNNIALAYQQWLERNVPRANELLHACPPALRHWEWGYLKRLCNAELLTCFGHRRDVHSVAFSPDGARLASAGQDDKVRLWDAATGRELLVLHHPAYPTCVRFSPNGRRLASANCRGDVKVWDAATGKELLAMAGQEKRDGWVYGISFSPDGAWIATAGPSNAVRVWHAATGKEGFCLPGHRASVRQAVFGPDGTQLAAADFAGEVKVWDVATRREVATFRGHVRDDTHIRSLAFSPDGKRIASSDLAGVRLWDPRTGKQERGAVSGSRRVSSLAFSPDGRHLVFGKTDRAVEVWSVQTRQRLFVLGAHGGTVRSVAYSPDGSRIASASEDGMVKVWDARRSPEARAWTAHRGPVYRLAFSPGGSWLASLGKGGKAVVWQMPSGRRLAERVHDGGLACLSVAPDGKRVASVEGDDVVVWAAGSGEELLRFTAHAKRVGGVAFSPDGRRIATGGWEDKRVKIWDAATGRLRRSFAASTVGGGYLIQGMAFSPDGRRLVSGGGFGGRRDVWDVASGLPVISVPADLFITRCVAFSHDGRLVACGGHDGIVRVSDASTGQLVAVLKGHSEAVNGLAFSPDDRHLATASDDDTVKIWEPDTGRQVLTLRGHTGSVHSVAFSPDGQWLASGSSHWTIRLWRSVATAASLTLRGHSDAVLAVRFVGDGGLQALGSADKTATLWNVWTGQQVSKEPMDIGSARFPRPSQLAIAASGRLAAIAAEDKVALWWPRGDSGACVRREWTLRDGVQAGCLAFSPDSGLLAVALSAGVMDIRAMAHEDARHVLTVETGPLRSLAFSPDGERIAVGGVKGAVGIRRAADGKELLALQGHAGEVWCVAFSPDGQRLASAGSDGFLRLWHASSGKKLLSIKPGCERIRTMAFSPDGKWLAAPGQGHTMKVWDAESGRELCTFRGHTAPLLSAAFSPDGEWLVTGSADRTAKIWHARSGPLRPGGEPRRGDGADRPRGPLVMGGDAADELERIVCHEEEPPQDADHAEIVRAARARVRARGGRWVSAFEAARLIADCIPKAQEDKKLSGGDQQALAASYADEVARLLGIAAASTGPAAQAAQHGEEGRATTVLDAIRQALASRPDAGYLHHKTARALQSIAYEMGEAGRGPLAAPLFEAAIEIERELCAKHPKEFDYHNWLGGFLHNYVLHSLDSSKDPKAFQLLDESFRVQRQAIAIKPQSKQALRFLRNHFSLLAKRHLELRHHAEAAKAAGEMARVRPTDWRDAYYAAGLLAKCVSVAEADDACTQEERRRLAAKYGERGIAVLRACVEHCDDLPTLRRWLTSSSRVEALRRRKEFATLLGDVDARLEADNE